jgi:hypothetical protein
MLEARCRGHFIPRVWAGLSVFWIAVLKSGTHFIPNSLVFIGLYVFYHKPKALKVSFVI